MATDTFKYASDSSDIHPIRLEDSSVGTFNPEAAGAISSDISAIVSRNRRAFGLIPRMVNLSRRVGTAPNQGVRYKRLPILTATTFNGLAKGDTMTVDGSAWTVSSKSPEIRR